MDNIGNFKIFLLQDDFIFEQMSMHSNFSTLISLFFS
uniref:Uncharacterized protein n=1 Tax=Rhizophora mucronata TaxID=61149 RepID=A0A2P2IW81_RHIMU